MTHTHTHTHTHQVLEGQPHVLTVDPYVAMDDKCRDRLLSYLQEVANTLFLQTSTRARAWGRYSSLGGAYRAQCYCRVAMALLWCCYDVTAVSTSS